MGSDKIRYLVFVNGRWRWRPTLAMRRMGFALRTFGATLTSEDRAEAIRLNDDWDRARQQKEPVQQPKTYPRGSVADGYMRAMAMRRQGRKDQGTSWTPEQHSRDDWPRAWKWIEPALGDVGPHTIQPEVMQSFRAMVASVVSESEAFRTIKVWRALWKKMAVMGYCDLDRDPSLATANSAPPPRAKVWTDHDAKRMVQMAWRMGYRGLAALMAAAWDTQLSPVDVRRLTPSQRTEDTSGTYFRLDRAKTGRAAAATLSRWSRAILDAYLSGLGFEILDTAPIFRTRHVEPTMAGGRRWLPRPYTKDKLGKDFAVVRAAVFGPAEKRQLADMRRSGTVEAFAGGATAGGVSTKMANTLSASSRLQKTYNPVEVATVRQVDEARQVGRGRMREQKGAKSVTTPARKSVTGASDGS